MKVQDGGVDQRYVDPHGFQIAAYGPKKFDGTGDPKATPMSQKIKKVTQVQKAAARVGIENVQLGSGLSRSFMPTEIFAKITNSTHGSGLAGSMHDLQRSLKAAQGNFIGGDPKIGTNLDLNG